MIFQNEKKVLFSFFWGGGVGDGLGGVYCGMSDKSCFVTLVKKLWKF